MRIGIHFARKRYRHSSRSHCRKPSLSAAAAATAIRGTAAVLAQLFAVGMIDEPVCNVELAVERKQQRQARRADRIDVLVFAAIPPDAPQALVALAVLAEDDGGRVV